MITQIMVKRTSPKTFISSTQAVPFDYLFQSLLGSCHIDPKFGHLGNNGRALTLKTVMAEILT